VKVHTSISVALFCLELFFAACHGQSIIDTNQLVPQQIIVLPNVKGRIDHLDVDKKEGVVYVAALGNNTLEAVDLLHGKVLHSIAGLDEPQGVGYIPQQHEIFVANGGSGQCDFYNASTYEKITSLKLSSDADDVRYDSIEKKVYVGYGEGGIAIIDAVSHKQVGDIELPAHPEGFQLDKALNRLYVNVPDAHLIAVIDLEKQQVVERWKTVGSANFPMAIDTTNHVLFVGYRRPAQFSALDGRSGKILATEETVGDMDDLYFDPPTRQVMVSGGGGAVEVFQQEGNGYHKVAHLPTRNGARTSLLIPSLRLFVLAERAADGKKADLLIYKLAGK
jgi:DNA-binding beta-propeller fold protein YncE